ncbi:P-type DNA transfer protein VirB5 [Pseudomonas huaxiensis]|uniref:P-type DNA transfer protein VirB5 n=1 Tax=Pseudomonas huaxiensis TaxID=2213017 RepID=UPI000DA6CC3B|nr:P-type DNA transfer protein VirB5 [Pseudomonas huaxiensis]
MKKKISTVIVFCLFSISILPTVTLATGIPTVDVAAAAILQNNAIAQATQALDALNNAKNGIAQARQQYENYKSLVSGNDKLGRFLNSPSLNKVLPLGEWSEVYNTATDIVALRKRYGLISDNLSVQQKFDMMLAAVEALERNYNASTERVSNAEALRSKLDEVETPQQKSDLQLRYQQEIIEQQNQQMRIANIQMLQQQQEKIMDRQRAQAFMDRLNGK